MHSESLAKKHGKKYRHWSESPSTPPKDNQPLTYWNQNYPVTLSTHPSDQAFGGQAQSRNASVLSQ